MWWKLFEHGFEHLDAARCPSKESLYTAGESATLAESATAMLAADAWIELWNFGETTPEERWRETLSSDLRVVVMQGNLLIAPGHTMGDPDHIMVRPYLGRMFEASFKPTAGPNKHQSSAPACASWNAQCTP